MNDWECTSYAPVGQTMCQMRPEGAADGSAVGSRKTATVSRPPLRLLRVMAICRSKLAAVSFANEANEP